MADISYKIFDLVVTTRSLAKAAELAHLSPSAVSHSLLKLERELGMQLLIRSRDGVRLTSKGQELLPHVRFALNAETKLQEEIARISGVSNGSIRLGTFNSVCCSWMPDIVRLMHEKYPLIELQIVQGGYDDLENALITSELDAAFVSVPTKSNLPTVPLMRDRLLCVTPEDFRPADPNCITIDEMREQTFILPREGYDFDACIFLEANSLEVHNPHDIAEDASIAALVESGFGITIMPELVLDKVHGKLGIYQIESAPFRTIGIATQRTEYVTPSVRLFLKVVQDYVHERYPVDLPYFRNKAEGTS